MIGTFPNIIAFAMMCVLLLIGTVLRSKLKFLQSNLVPASLIGGVIGFVVMAVFRLNADGEYNFAAFTFHFFTLSFMSLCLMSRGDKSQKGSEVVKGGLWLTLIWTFSLVMQAILGFGLIMGFNALSGNSIPEYLGALATHGFTQGPGQALTIGTIWENNYDISHAASIGLIFASLGFVAAFTIGVPIAKWAIKKGYNSNRTASITPDFLKGFYQPETRESAGRQVTHPSNIDSFAFHISILGLAYIITHFWLINMQALVGSSAPFDIRLDILFSHNLFFVHGLTVCVILRAALDRFGVGHYIDDETQKRITGSAVDFMVVGTLLSIQFAVLVEFLVPIFLVAIVVTLATAILCFGAGRRLSHLGVERSLTAFGCCTGSTGTGLLLLRLIDPDFSTSVSRELALFNVAIVMTSIHIWAIAAPILPSMTPLMFMVVYGGTVAGCTIVLFLFNRKMIIKKV